MKIKKTTLKKIIKEELKKATLGEEYGYDEKEFGAALRDVGEDWLETQLVKVEDFLDPANIARLEDKVANMKMKQWKGAKKRLLKRALDAAIAAKEDFEQALLSMDLDD